MGWRTAAPGMGWTSSPPTKELQKDFREDLQKDLQKDLREDVNEDLQKDWPRDLREDWQEDLQRGLPKNLQKDLQKESPCRQARFLYSRLLAARDPAAAWPRDKRAASSPRSSC